MKLFLKHVLSFFLKNNDSIPVEDAPVLLNEGLALNRKASQVKSQLAYKTIARRFNCSTAMVTYALQGKRNSELAKQIRAHVTRLVSRNRMAA